MQLDSASSCSRSSSDTATSSSAAPEASMMTLLDGRTTSSSASSSIADDCLLPRRSYSMTDTVSVDENANKIVVTEQNIKVPRRSIKRIFSSMKIRRRKNWPADETSSSSTISSLLAESVPTTAKTISSDTLLREDEARPALSTPARPESAQNYRIPGSVSSNSSAEKRIDEEAPLQTKKKKYFTEKNKSIFRKLLHPSYQERNVQYRRLFGHLVAESDLFLISFSCAYQREILCQGRMYISQRNVCFHANILGWETCFAVPFDEITNITREKAAFIIPNSIQFETKSGEKYFFASLVSREKTATALSMVLERRAQNQDISPEEMWERLNTDAMKRSTRGSKSGLTPSSTNMDYNSPPSTPHMPTSFPVRSASEGYFVTSPTTTTSSGGVLSPVSPALEDAASLSSLEDQDEVTCTCSNHFGKELLNIVFPLSVHELRQLVFHDGPWFTQFNETLKNSGYHSSEWAVDKSGQLNRTCTYTMALNHAMAPKSCVVTENQVIHNINPTEPGAGFIVNKETQNSGVPYADHFTVQCTYCVTRVSRRECRLLVHGGINYKKTIWGIVKGYIERNTYQGLDDHYDILRKMIAEECQRRQMASGTSGPDVTSTSGIDPSRRCDDDASENESLSSSVEDPTTDSPTKERAFIKSKSHRVALVSSSTSAYAARKEEVISANSSSMLSAAAIPDYGPYIRIIIGLLAGLLLLHVLLIVRISWMEHDPSGLRDEMSQFLRRMSPSTPPVPTAAPADTKILESLLETVSQLAADLQKLKQQRDEL